MPAGCVDEHARRTDTYGGDKDNTQFPRGYFNGKGITHKERDRCAKHTGKGREGKKGAREPRGCLLTEAARVFGKVTSHL